MQIAITKMSSKGQIVIPSDLREDMKEREQLIIIKNNNQLILKKVNDLGKNLEHRYVLLAILKDILSKSKFNLHFD